MKILIAGASGFIGKSLVSALAPSYKITVLGRNKRRLKEIFPEQRAIDFPGLATEPIENYTVVINLCGESIDKRWTVQQKAKIISSRVEPTEKLANWVLRSPTPERIRFLNASAVGIYGLNTIQNTEDTLIKTQEHCFLQQVVSEWELTVEKKLKNKINYTLMRFGVVLKKQQGMLKKLELPYKLGLASILGHGKQQISWIHIEDLVRAIDFVVKNATFLGPVNMVAPEVITQKSLCQVLAQALDRPCLLKTPSIVVKLIFGQMGSELLLSGQEVIAKKLTKANFSFLYPTFPAAIFHEYK